MDRSEFSALRVMLVSGKSHAAQTLRSVLTIANVTKIVMVDNSRRALELLSLESFDAVYCEEGCDPIDGLSFPLAVRRAGSVLTPMMPVFVFQERTRRRDVEKARDIGATDVITCPISPRTVMTKLKAALANPRPFIKAPEFFGPDRRAKARPQFHGEDRRSRTPRKIKVTGSGEQTLL